MKNISQHGEIFLRDKNHIGIISYGYGNLLYNYSFALYKNLHSLSIFIAAYNMSGEW
jgi:hypothetical protein